ncbi:ATP-binding protein [Promicromonospora sp. MEB111]|uniref:AlbA family DNA-binding domain-containing protein n=1 Tax=Promicromonospora sp. MEB111 TaxID=3040301 RepID=UPI0025517795|nr:ATP-binding protein [Promicromonospora sp. MEB111]
MAARFLRVEQALALTTGLFDATGDEVWQAVQRAISLQTPEAADLEFKSQWWDNTKEFAKDCAAFANATGGVLIYGVNDDGRDVAAGLSPVNQLDDFEERVQSITASRIAPKLPQVHVRWVPNPDSPGTGIGIVAIPRSPNSPHAVVNQPQLSYPVRRSTMTVYLSESEVADRYRNRLEMARSDQDRAQEIIELARPALARAGNAWVAVAFIPSLPGELPLSAAEPDAALDLVYRWQGEMPLEPAQHRSLDARVRRKRIVVTSDPSSPVSHYQHHELWLDGSGFAAAAVGSLKRARTLQWTNVEQPELEFAILRLVDLLVKHAVRAGAAGDGIFVAQLLPAWEDDSLDVSVSTPDSTRTGQAIRAGIPLLIDVSRTPDESELAHARRVDGESVQVTAPLDAIAESAQELVMTVRRLTVDMLAEDGMSDSTLLTAAGQIDSLQLRQAWLREVEAWANECGIPLLERRSGHR